MQLGSSLEQIAVLRGAEADDGALLELSGGLDLDVVDVNAVGRALVLHIPAPPW